MQLSALTSEELFERYRPAKDVGAFRVLHDRHNPELLRQASAHLGEPSKARDAVQDAWRMVLIRCDQWRNRGPGSLMAWIRRILSRQCLNIQRKTPACEVIAGDAFPARADSEGLESELMDWIPPDPLLRRLIAQAFHSLSKKERKLLWWAARRRKHEAIARRLQIDIKTVKSRVFDARRKMARFLASREYPVRCFHG